MKTPTMIAALTLLAASSFATAGARTDGIETLSRHFNFHAGMPNTSTASKVETAIMELKPRPPVTSFVRSGADSGYSGLVNKGWAYAPAPGLNH